MSALAEELRQVILHEGPIGIERFMALCLGHPRHGYYMSRDPLGRGGDFVTAPEVSQMFGELVGLWVAETWRLMGSPASPVLTELGPGRGTLMADALRALRIVPGLRESLLVHLVETSPVLRRRQRATLSDAGVPIAWHDRIEDVPERPAIIVANEFFDALPVRQFVRAADGWRERLVGIDRDGALAFGLAPQLSREIAADGAVGACRETSPAGLAIAGTIAARVASTGGAALIIDYGHAGGSGDTLQAVKGHRFADPLAEPGEADLTAHVDFAALARAAGESGAAVHGPVAQGRFLNALGLARRAARLGERADRTQQAAIDTATRRLAGDREGEMGALFKVMAIAHPDLPQPSGFDSGSGAGNASRDLRQEP